MAEVILMTSGKGGVGKSTICGFLGESLARRGQRVLMIETAQRSLDVLFAVSDRIVYDLADAAAGRCTLAEAMVPVGSHEGMLVCAPLSGRLDTPVTTEVGKALLLEVNEKFDHILIEVPGKEEALLDAFSPLAERAVVVTTADRASARDSRVVSDYLAKSGVWDIRLCINMLAPDFVRQRPVPDLDWLIDTVCAQLISVCSFQPQLFSMTNIQESVDSSKDIATIFDNFAQRILGKYIDLWVW